MAFPKRGLLASVGLLFLFVVYGLPWMISLGVSFTVFLGMGGRSYVVLVFKTLPRDIKFIVGVIPIMRMFKEHHAKKKTISDLFSETASRYPDKTAIIFEEQKWTFRELEEFTNRVANHFHSLGLKKGDCVALFVGNCPEFIGVWLGLGKLGVVTAFVNNQLQHEALTHCVKIVSPRAIVFHASLSDAVQAILPDLDRLFPDLDLALSDMCYSICGESSIPQAKSLEAEIEGTSAQPPPPPPDKSFDDKLCYIYTSGTTGMPKACSIKNYKFFGIGTALSTLSGVTSDDIIYNTLPTYHSNGGVIAVGPMLFKGCTCVLRKKFSASNFWNDCIKHQCTVFIYIGEVCRYLLAQPKRPSDTQHCVRLVIGNGLRPQIWKEFQKRFQLQRIVEFYGATEGNCGAVNTVGKVGACGALSVVLSSLSPICLIKVDPDTREYIRDSNGFCVRAGPNEQGEMTGLIDEKMIGQRFDGYENEKATQKKIMRNVFKPGDAYFLSGDILRMDEEGFLFFCDRTGDTFRWKGENASTTEVESVMANILQLRDVVVYGVEVPGMEGRAGMAAIVDSDDEKKVNLDNLAQQLYLSLPSYAVPVFIRLVKSVELTGTYKYKKSQLRKEGFSQEQVSDPLFMLDPGQKVYIPFTPEMYQQLASGAMRL